MPALIKIDRFVPVLAAACAVATPAHGDPGDRAGAPPVQVIVDLDTTTPGFQSTRTIAACTESVENIGVFVLDPQGRRPLWSIGYLGGLDRGISLGHRPQPALNQGSVTGFVATLGAPVNPGNGGWIVPPPGIDPGFAGPEVQYLEHGADAPAPIPADPAQPIFTLRVDLEGAQPGDAFELFLLDYVAVWSAGTGGAFSTQGAINALDTGGDVVPDGTDSIYGVDPDHPIAVPPAAFAVDYIDGQMNAGGAVLVVVAAPGDLDGNGAVTFADLLLLLVSWGPCSPDPPCAADLDASGDVGVADLLILLASWGSC